MKVLGIDPGFGRMGWAVLEGNRQKQVLIDSGCVETSVKETLEQRLYAVFVEVKTLACDFRPDCAALEELFFFKNQKTVMQVGQSRGAIIAAAMESSLPIFHYTPLQVKQSISGYGRAEKSQVQKMVKSILKLPTILKPDDAADAAAVALTHFFTNQILK